ncbi:hypothetical protein CEUSTIGMA_g6987.t1 [Chlamydomonas eustigma]|uniref:Uncharacterized protein n=1 Tax=Chlamydomonas eustigma TaxID=1157962 RepID=A0A250X907_9CHLO|nr:hypothetical protein CEUSTIGMA_g6987.t1 [Chlamydomonas eustigma]|eukprot:GAX79546.1 hypothetical protein CEUSTIGMA_g6987.t1 [Chlamydomonas eustigma]
MDRTIALTPSTVLDTAGGKDFLLQCLKKSRLDDELLNDVADACEMHDPILTAVRLGCGELTPEIAADMLFLMLDEAKDLLVICKQECLRIGVNFGDGSVYVPEEEGERSQPDAVKKEEKSASHISFANGHHSIDSASKTLAEATSDETCQREVSSNGLESHSQAVIPVKLASNLNPSTSENVASMESVISNGHASTSSSRSAFTPAANKKATLPSLSKPMVSHSSVEVDAFLQPTAAPPVQLIQKKQKRPTTASSPATSSFKALTYTSSQVSTHTVDSISSSALGTTPVSKPRARPSTAQVPKSVVTAPKLQPTPSYARPTASYQHSRKSEGEMGEEVSSSSPSSRRSPVSLPVPCRSPEPEVIKRVPKKTAFAHISASLLRPTKAFLAWTSGNSREDREQKAGLASSQMLRASYLKSGKMLPGSTKLPLTGLKPELSGSRSRLPTTPAHSAASAPTLPMSSAAFLVGDGGDNTPVSSLHINPSPGAIASYGKSVEKQAGRIPSARGVQVPETSQLNVKEVFSAPVSRRGTREVPMPGSDGMLTREVSCKEAASVLLTPPNFSRLPSASAGGATSRSGIPKPPISTSGTPTSTPLISPSFE